jgi:NAD(P)-dependent dehydrogenase (short-subunit alcohol dehydrogenase family)
MASGAAPAERLVEEGAWVGICGRDPERLETTQKRLIGLGGDVLAVQADVTRPQELAAFVDAAVDRWNRIDGLVNKAGRSAAGRIEQVTEEQWTGDLELKLLAAVRAVPGRTGRERPMAAPGGGIRPVDRSGQMRNSLPMAIFRLVGPAAPVNSPIWQPSCFRSGHRTSPAPRPIWTAARVQLPRSCPVGLPDTTLRGPP